VPVTAFWKSGSKGLKMELTVRKIDGSNSGDKITLPEALFNIETPSEHAIYMAVVSEETANRQGTHDSRTRAMVRGGGRKPFRQKGTGNARQGTIRAPQYRGGGRVFGPEPRVYEKKINRKLKLLARKSAFTIRAREEKVIVIEDFSWNKPQTSQMDTMLKALDLSGKRVLVLTGVNDTNLYLSSRNIYKLDLKPFDQPSVRDIVRCEYIVMQKSAVSKLQEVHGG
jgi:large subunit ribosomal protein L4